MSTVAIGIDLGTTYTVAAIYRNSQAEIIPNTEGDRLTPSLVFYHPRNLVPSVGKVAENLSVKCPKNYMFDIKRIIGRNYNDDYVQRYVKMEESKQYPYKIIKGNNNEPLIKLEANDDALIATKSPEEISSEVLRYIKKSAEEYLGVDVHQAVISVPAYFSYAQKAATKRAAELVGFKVLKLITEPVAAAINYTFRKMKEEINIVMFDLGGGTLDVSIIQVSKDNFEVKAIEGDMFLGGRDFDEVLYNYLRVEVGKRQTIFLESPGPLSTLGIFNNTQSPTLELEQPAVAIFRYGNQLIKSETMKGQRFLHRLRRYANRYKHMLTSVDEYSIIIEIDGDSECEFCITRDMLEILSEELFTRIIDKVKQSLSSAKLAVSAVDKVVLVGGASRMPKLRELLSSTFNGIELSTDLNPDEAVALGASIHAALLMNQIRNEDKYKITEVAPFSLGVKSKYDLMVEFIQKGTVVPITRKQTMQTTENNQKTVIFEIYEGERKDCKQNKRLGEFSIKNLPLGRTGEVKLEVAFYLDEDGLLSVYATEKSTGCKNELQIKMQHLTLCDSAKLISFDKEQVLREEDRLYDNFYRLKLQADEFCKAVLYDLEDSNLGIKKYTMEVECQKFLDNTKKMHFRDIEILQSDFNALQKRVNAWLFQYGSVTRVQL